MSSPEPAPFPEWPEPAVTGVVEVTDGSIEFTPVPRLRKRRNGWSEECQRPFIEALSECGCMTTAARITAL
jgi:hypothetical protein